MDADAAHLAAIVAAAVEQVARDDALGEDAALVVDVLEKQVDRGEPLGQAAPSVPHSAAVMMRGSRSNGKMRSVPCFVAVDREGDALGQKGAVGFDLVGDRARRARRRAARRPARDTAAGPRRPRRTSRRSRPRES